MFRFSVFILTISFLFSLHGDIKEAKKAYSQKQFARATKLFLEVAKANPGSGEPYMYLGYIYESQRNFPKSIQMFRKAVELRLEKKYKQNCYLKVMLYYNYHQDWDLALMYANRLLKLNPKLQDAVKIRDRAAANRGTNPNPPVIRPEIEVKKKNESFSEPEKAIHFYEKALKEKPGDEEILWELSQWYYKIGNFNKSYQSLHTLLQKKPKNKNYLYKAGMAKLRSGEYQSAIDLFNEAIQNSYETDYKLLYYVYLNQAVAYHKMKNLAVATKLYRKSLLYQKTSAPLIGLNRVKYETDDYENCIQTSIAILEKYPKEYEAMYYKGICSMKLGKKKEGITALLKFRKFQLAQSQTENPSLEKFHDGYFELAKFYSNRKKYKLADKYFKLVAPTKETTNEFSFYYGKMLLFAKNTQKSIQVLEAMKQSHPAKSYLLSKAYAISGNFPKAKEFLVDCAGKKELYWKKPLKDLYFVEFLKIKENVQFLESKGKVPPAGPPQPTQPKTTNQAPVNSNSTPEKNQPQR